VLAELRRSRRTARVYLSRRGGYLMLRQCRQPCRALSGLPRPEFGRQGCGQLWKCCENISCLGH
jgi:hypothetical protein